MKRNLIYMFAFICLNVSVIATYAQLGGTYLIGPNAPKYKTISMAVQDLYLNHGVKSAVIFNIQDGVYDEQIYIPQINNTNATNTVTFQSLSGDSSKVIIRFKPNNDTFNYTLMLDGANFLVFKKLTFTTDTVFGRVIDINNKCSFNQFISNRIIGMPGSKELIYSESTPDSWDNYNRFEKNFLQYGSKAISFYGTDEATMEEGNEIFKNLFIDQSQQAIDLKYNYKFKVYNNIISSSAGIADYTAIRIQFCKDKFYIEKNKIDINNKSHLSHGISILFCNGINVALASSISNNFIHITSNTYVYVGGIEILGSYKNFFYNSIHLTGNNDAAIGFNEISASDININNNIFSNASKGIALILNDTTNIFCDYNDLYSTGTDVTSDGMNYYSTLSAWNSASGQDQHSLSTDPLFFSDVDLHTKNFRLTKRGKVISGINEDIDGNSRKSPNPDIGADEFIYKLDLGPDRYVCAGNATTIYAEKGFDSYLWSDGSNNDTITIDSAGIGLGTTKVKLSVTYQTDNYADSILVHFVVAQASLGANKAVCEDETVVLQATGGVKFKWNTGDTLSSISFKAAQSAQYSVIVTDQYGCIDSASVWVNVKPRPAKPVIIPVGSDSLMSSIVGPVYKWYKNKLMIPETTQYIKVTVNGIYQVIIFDSSCHSDTSAGYNFQKNSIDNTTKNSQIKLYPNPASDVMIMELSGINPIGSQIEIISAFGQTILHTDNISLKTEIITSAYEKGLYILRFTNGDQIITRRFVVE